MFGPQLTQEAPGLGVVAGNAPKGLRPPDESAIDVVFDHENRSRGLTWFSVYRVVFDATYTFHPAEGGHGSFRMSLPDEANIDDLLVEVGGEPVPVTTTSLAVPVPLAPRTPAVVRVRYVTSGQDAWAYHPRALPLAVPTSTLHMAAKRGMDVTVLRPEGFALPDAMMQKASAAAEQSGGSVVETDNRAEAMEGAHVIYAKSWSSTQCYGDKLGDQKLREELIDWCVDEPWFDNAKDDCRFMHCLPVRRGVVVADNILDGPRSVVIAEARNRMLAQMAVLHQMLGGSR